MIAVHELTVRLAEHTLVGPISFRVDEGKVVALVGESGSGKTTTGLALLREYPDGACVDGRVISDSNRVGYVPQHPGAVLTPSRRVGSLMREVAKVKGAEDPASTVARAVARSQLDPSLLRRFPHQLSGGQQQRTVIAIALLGDPECLVVDEPTTGQDPEHRDALAAELEAVRQQGTAIVLLSHDLALVRRLADETVVLRQGSVIEQGAHLWERAREPYTRRLLEAGLAELPAGRSASTSTPSPVLRVENLTAGYGRGRAPVLRDLDLELEAGTALTVRGPSGSGKSTLARSLAGLHQPYAGELQLWEHMTPWSVRARSRADRARLQYVFQDARAAFDPFRPIGAQVIRPAVNLCGTSRREAEAALIDITAEVGLRQHHLRRPAQTLSGGELQRAALARALLTRPDLLICDEITTGLDSITRETVVKLLERLVAAGMTLVVITHDDRVAHHFADRVLTLGCDVG